MIEKKFRSTCPISSGLDLFGDKWTLLIVRDLLDFGKRTFKDFMQADEHISSARLTDRLKKLDSAGILIKEQHPTNQKVFIYSLTQKGKDLAPLIADILSWSAKYLPEHVSPETHAFAEKLEIDREAAIAQFVKN